MSERQVVVNVRCVIQQHKDDGVFAARFPQLGLSAFGETEDEAIVSSKRLFNRFINTYRSVGKLEEVLNSANVEWYWLDEYPGDRPAFEDTNKLFEPVNAVGIDPTAFIDFPDNPATLPQYRLQLEAWTDPQPAEHRMAA